MFTFSLNKICLRFHKKAYSNAYLLTYLLKSVHASKLLSQNKSKTTLHFDTTLHCCSVASNGGV